MVGLVGCCHGAHTTAHLGSSLVLRVMEQWCNFQRVPCSSPFIALVENICHASSLSALF